MNWYKKIIASFTAVKSNPSKKDLIGKEVLRAWLTRGELIVWDSFKAMHYLIAEKMKTRINVKEDIPLIIYLNDDGSINSFTVTDSSRRGKWNESPKVKNQILSHPSIKNLLPESELREDIVGYWNEAEVGPWHEKNKKERERLKKKAPVFSFE